MVQFFEDYNTDAFIVNKAGASDNKNYGIWMTNAEKIRGGFESASGIAFYSHISLSYVMETGITS